jgi:hypothetical protein
MPTTTLFTDSSEFCGPFINQGEKNAIDFGKNLTFLGRAGIKKVQGLRIAFVSGVDSDILGTEVWGSRPQEKYLAQYFV